MYSSEYVIRKGKLHFAPLNFYKKNHFTAFTELRESMSYSLDQVSMRPFHPSLVQLSNRTMDDYIDN